MSEAHFGRQKPKAHICKLQNILGITKTTFYRSAGVNHGLV